MNASLSRHDSRLALSAGHTHRNKNDMSLQSRSPGESSSPSTELGRPSTMQKHQRFVFTDPVVFRYLIEPDEVGSAVC
jgi:hypothetical protein